MLDTVTHTFKANNKGLVWLLFVTMPAILITAFFVYLIVDKGSWDTATILAFIAMAVILLFGLTMLYADWVSYLFAVNTTLEVDMQTREFTFKHDRKTICFKPSDVAHWYVDVGFFASRVATHHTVVILKSGKELFIPMWLFEGNRFLMTMYPSENTFNANNFIITYQQSLFFPQPEKGPRYKYIFPPDNF